MIDLDEIEREISMLEARENSYATLERLAWLYTVRREITPKLATQTVSVNPSSEFLEACQETPFSSLLAVLDEHMDALKVVYPREHAALLSRIRELK